MSLREKKEQAARSAFFKRTTHLNLCDILSGRFTTEESRLLLANLNSCTYMVTSNCKLVINCSNELFNQHPDYSIAIGQKYNPFVPVYVSLESFKPITHVPENEREYIRVMCERLRGLKDMCASHKIKQEE